ALDQCLARESIFPRIRRLGGGARGEAPGVPVPRATSATMAERTLGVIGGSGLYELPGLADFERTRVRTPFGDPSDEIVAGRLAGTRLLFLPRHGRGHRPLPSELTVCATAW